MTVESWRVPQVYDQPKKKSFWMGLQKINKNQFIGLVIMANNNCTNADKVKYQHMLTTKISQKNGILERRVATGQGKVREIQCQGKVREF